MVATYACTTHLRDWEQGLAVSRYKTTTKQLIFVFKQQAKRSNPRLNGSLVFNDIHSRSQTDMKVYYALFLGRPRE